ncbi:MAG: EVE domain-containing protein [Phycisphaerae bacterium]|nr:EVE domain-containing protein [Phycisphaerae bacterium]
MAFWLLKTEPDDYDWDSLQRDRQTVWDGIGNNAALKNLRAVKPGDLAFIYHTGTQRAIVGTAEITSAAYPDPKEKDERMIVIDVKAKHALPRQITLNEIKGDPVFARWDLIRQGRLSVVPVSAAIWKHVQALSKRKVDS